jgi:trehalose synthase
MRAAGWQGLDHPAVDRPADPKAFGHAVRLLLDDPAEATRMGLAAHAYVRDNYIGDIHLLRYATLLGALLAGGLASQAI